MGNDSMMALSENLNAQFDGLVEECMSSSQIDLSLYQEYDVKEGCVTVQGRECLQGLLKSLM